MSLRPFHGWLCAVALALLASPLVCALRVVVVVATGRSALAGGMAPSWGLRRAVIYEIVRGDHWPVRRSICGVDQ